MSIYIVRHAESEANINGRTLSHGSIQLSQNGLHQAEALIKILPKIDKVIISKYIRTHQTAKPIIDYYGIEVEVDENLHEFSYLSETKCANTTLDERKAWVDEYWDKLDIDYQDAKDAESFRALYHRVEAFADKLQQLFPKYLKQNLLVVSHGQFIQLLMMYVNQKCELTTALMQDFRHELKTKPIKNAQIFQYSLDAIELVGGEICKLEKSKS